MSSQGSLLEREGGKRKSKNNSGRGNVSSEVTKIQTNKNTQKSDGFEDGERSQESRNATLEAGKGKELPPKIDGGRNTC